MLFAFPLSTQEQAFHDTPVPVFFSEYGAHNGRPREFHETARGLYDPSMTGTFSGGVVYEFLWSANRYGLVKLKRLTSSLPQPSPPSRQPRMSVGEDDMEGEDGKHEDSITVNCGPAPPTIQPKEEEDGDTHHAETAADVGVTEILQKLPDFENLRKALQRCRDQRVPLSSSPPPSPTTTRARPRPPFPEVSRSWRASPGAVLPPSPLDWDEVEAQIRADREWLDVGDFVDR